MTLVGGAGGVAGLAGEHGKSGGVAVGAKSAAGKDDSDRRMTSVTASSGIEVESITRW